MTPREDTIRLYLADIAGFNTDENGERIKGQLIQQTTVTWMAEDEATTPEFDKIDFPFEVFLDGNSVAAMLYKGAQVDFEGMTGFNVEALPPQEVFRVSVTVDGNRQMFLPAAVVTYMTYTTFDPDEFINIATAGDEEE